jgi:outer membrane immunogenic protein
MYRALILAAIMAVTTPALAQERHFSWTGFYIGAHAGYAWGDHDISVAHPCPQCLPAMYQADAFAGSKPFGGNAFVGGGQIGADKQFGSLVLGVAIDASKGDLKGEQTIRMDYDTDWAIQTKVEWFGSARARLGFTTGQLLMYATGGVAWAKVATDMQTISITGPVTMSELSGNAWHVGYVVGGGVEWAFAPNWTLSAEYLHYDFGAAAYDPKGTAYAGTPGAFAHHELAKGDLQMQVARGGINFRF